MRSPVPADEAQEVGEATGSHVLPYGALLLAAWRGDEGTVQESADASMRDARRRGEGIGVAVVQAALAVLHNSVGRFPEAGTAAAAASAFPDDLVASSWGLVESVEAAARTGTAPRRRSSGCRPRPAPVAPTGRRARSSGTSATWSPSSV